MNFISIKKKKFKQLPCPTQAGLSRLTVSLPNRINPALAQGSSRQGLGPLLREKVKQHLLAVGTRGPAGAGPQVGVLLPRSAWREA